MKNLTPVLIVESIEPVIGFWEALGFEKTMEVPHGEAIGFCAFVSGDVQIMYQTVESVRDDVESLADVPTGGANLFIEVEDLEEVGRILEGMDGLEYIVERRTTFYGAEEIIVREPGGNVVNFAEFGEESEG